MSLKYALLEAHLTPAPNDYVAKVQDVPNNDMDDIMNVMAQTGEPLDKAAFMAMYKRFSAAIVNITKDGETVSTDLFKTNFSMQGTFDGADDHYETNRHTIHANMQAGAVLKDAVAHIGVEKIHAPEVHPHVLEVKDAVSGSTNQTLTSQGVVEIVGSMLKIAGKHAKNGVYFVDNDNKAHKADTLVDNKPARLIVIVPVLTSGEYTLQIRTQHSGSTFLKNPRTGTFDKPLTVT